MNRRCPRLGPAQTPGKCVSMHKIPMMPIQQSDFFYIETFLAGLYTADTAAAAAAAPAVLLA